MNVSWIWKYPLAAIAILAAILVLVCMIIWYKGVDGIAAFSKWVEDDDDPTLKDPYR